MDTRNKFELGIEGEEWENELQALLVPCGDKRVLVVEWNGSFLISNGGSFVAEENILMAIARVHQIIADYHAK